MRKFLFSRLTFLVVVACALTAYTIHDYANRKPVPRNDTPPMPVYFEGSPVSLEGGVGWINVGAPIRIEDLRGKVVLLDFWTYCCINCHHVIPDLAYLENKYPNELVVIGVHTPKFTAERDTENIRRKVAEYRIKHPVINDANQTLWNRFNVSSWPTLVLIDANGKFVGGLPGEGHRRTFDREIGRLIAAHKAKGEINETPIKFFPESERASRSPLLYPGKILADSTGKRLFTTDTGHNRIIMSDLDGKNVITIGSGGEGLVDGDFAKACFNRPQGICLVDNVLYVADTENHAIRAVDLTSKTVSTVAGTGVQGTAIRGRKSAKTTPLTSPWDVALIPGSQTLAIAMAGCHQIWSLNLKTRTVAHLAGSSMEQILDGGAEDSAFAQPSGLASDGANHLFVADSEVSGIREITLGKSISVQSIVGQGLFEYGDIDGKGEGVRLQHCLGVAHGDGKLFIADTYNCKIKVCDVRSRTVKTLLGKGTPGESDDPPMFYQPGGLSYADGKLYIADTDNGLVRVADLATNKVHTLTFENLTPPAPARPKKPSKFLNQTLVDIPLTRVKPGNKLTVDVALTLPKGMKLNLDAASPYYIDTPGVDDAVADPSVDKPWEINPPKDRFTIEIPLAKTFAAGDKLPLQIAVSTIVCKTGQEGLCTPKTFVWKTIVEFAQNGSDKIELGVPR